MKKYILINAAWLILALGAFLLGRSNPRDTAESKELSVAFREKRDPDSSTFGH